MLRDQGSPFSHEDNYSQQGIKQKAATEFGEMEYDVEGMRGVSDKPHTSAPVTMSRCQDYQRICRCHPGRLKGTRMMKVLIAA